MENPPTSPQKPASLPDKTPAPLLSRRKKEQGGAKVVKYAPVSTATPEDVALGIDDKIETEISEDPESPLTSTPRPPIPAMPVSLLDKIKKKFPAFSLIVAWAIALGAVGALGYSTYLMFRETRLEGVVAAPSVELQEVAVVRDFRPEALMLANELAMSRTPLLSDIHQAEENFARVRGDVAGREERHKLLSQEVEGLEKEIDTVVKETQAEAKGLWETEGVALNADYEEKLTGFQKMLVDRAKELNIKFEPSQDYRVPEVWVNAFRLALYNMGGKGTNPTAQRQWAEQQLEFWKQYSKGWDEKMANLKERIKKVQQSPKDRVEQITGRRNDLRAQMAETEVEVGPLRRDMEEQQVNLAKAQEEVGNLEKSFYPQLVKTVENNKLLTINFRPEDKTFAWRHIDRLPQYPPGQYYLWLKGNIGNDEYWSFIPFTLNAYGTTELIIYTGSFVKVSDILRSAIVDQQ